MVNKYKNIILKDLRVEAQLTEIFNVMLGSHQTLFINLKKGLLFSREWKAGGDDFYPVRNSLMLGSHQTRTIVLTNA